MNKKTRTFLFFFFFAIFVIATPAIFAYSQGYRIDWAQKIIVQTGALALEPRPAPVDVYFDGKIYKRSNFVFQNIFAGNLVPKVYDVEVRKDGYSIWKKNLAVAPKLITEAKNIMLFPKERDAYEISSGIDDFVFSPSQKNVALTRYGETSRLFLYDLETAEEKLLFSSSGTFGNQPATFHDIAWNKDSTKILFSLENQTENLTYKESDADTLGEPKTLRQKKWILIDTAGPKPSVTDLSLVIPGVSDFTRATRDLSNPAIDYVRWDPSDSSRLFFIAYVRNTGYYLLFSYETGNNKLSDPLLTDAFRYTIEGNKVFYISSVLGSVNMLDLETYAVAQVSTHAIGQAFDASGDREIKFLNSSPLAILTDKTLYLFDAEREMFAKLAEAVDHAFFSSDKKKLLLQTGGNVYVHWLEDVHVQPFHDAGDSQLIVRLDDADTMRRAVWLTKDNEHIIFADQHSIQVSELDGRGQRNQHILAPRGADTLLYEEKKDMLYFVSEGTMYSLLLK